MKEKRQEPQKQSNESKPKSKERWSLFRNKGTFGEYYSFKKGDLKISINAELLKRLIKWADERFEKQNQKNQGEE
jgi:hypothetical protein